MENVNVNSESEDLKKMFADYKKQKIVDANTSKKTGSEMLTKYFTPRNDEEEFRILPLKTKFRKPLEEVIHAYFHKVQVTEKDGKVTKGKAVYCPACNDPKVQKMDSDGKPLFDQSGKPVMITAPCPLCDKAKQKLSEQDNTLFKLKLKEADMNPSQLETFKKNKEIFKASKDMEAKLHYIVKGIDVGSPKDGVKFWRFIHNSQKDGVMDLLEPALLSYGMKDGLQYSDPMTGCNLIINVYDKPNNLTKKTYRSVRSITVKKSPLHEDSITAKQWLDDETTWRDVFKAPKAPNITPFEFLEMLAKGYNPFWDERDPNNKHWVFPNHPDLEERANTRNQDLGGSTNRETKQASDLDNTVPYVAPTISNTTTSNVGTYNDNAMDLGATALAETSTEEVDAEINDIVENNNSNSDDDYDDEDLPF